MDETKPRRKKIESPFGENLRSIMKRRGLTHRQVAEMADVSVSVVNDWCGKGGSVPHDLTKVGQLAQRLGVRFDWLILGYPTEQRDLTLDDLFEEVPAEHLTGLFRIEAKRLVLKVKK